MDDLTLFEVEIEKGGTERDDTQIKQFILYFSEPELAEMKKLVKAGCSAELGSDKFEKGNASDLILTSLRKNYGTES
jgi:hypothetical protein